MQRGGTSAETEVPGHDLNGERHPTGRELAKRHQVPLGVGGGQRTIRAHCEQAVQRKVV